MDGDFLIWHNFSLQLLAQNACLLLAHLNATFSPVGRKHVFKARLEFFCPIRHKLFASVSDQLVRDLLRKCHNVVKRDSLTILDDF